MEDRRACIQRSASTNAVVLSFDRVSFVATYSDNLEDVEIRKYERLPSRLFEAQMVDGDIMRALLDAYAKHAVEQDGGDTE